VVVVRQRLAPGQMGRMQQPLLAGLLSLLHLLLAQGYLAELASIAPLAIWDCSARIWRGEVHSCHGRSSPAAAPAGVAAHGFTALCPDPVVEIEPISAG
jgi:hypothetical protein